MAQTRNPTSTQQREQQPSLRDQPALSSQQQQPSSLQHQQQFQKPNESSLGGGVGGGVGGGSGLGGGQLAGSGSGLGTDTQKFGGGQISGSGQLGGGAAPQQTALQTQQQQQQPSQQNRQLQRVHSQPPAQWSGLNSAGALDPYAMLSLTPQQMISSMLPYQQFNAIAASQPRMDVDLVENDKTYGVVANIPGFSKDSVHVTLDEPNNTMTIFADEKKAKSTDRGDFHRRERAWGSVSRTFTLPTNIDPNHISAKFEHGVLHVEIPKAAPHAQPDQSRDVPIG